MLGHLVLVSANSQLYFHLCAAYQIYNYHADLVFYCFTTTCRLIIILMTEIHVFSFPDSPKLLTTIATGPNPRGDF